MSTLWDAIADHVGLILLGIVFLCCAVGMLRPPDGGILVLAIGGWEKIMRKLPWRKIFWCSMLAVWWFNVGMWTQTYEHGSVRMWHNIDDGTPLNHGQISFDVELPHGQKFKGFGGCGPRLYSEDGGKTVWWNRIGCEIEKYNPDTLAYEPHAWNGWVEIK
jgi:hypothetical protein